MVYQWWTLHAFLLLQFICVLFGMFHLLRVTCILWFLQCFLRHHTYSFHLRHSSRSSLCKCTYFTSIEHAFYSISSCSVRRFHSG
ncbi:hypothetical protein C8R41DRAFT_587021 [Lentinula lateritia]|uniref:Secreted protein n=1 Tax=Lentinula lateritia TaxID=40482 RepID=A0ABQ8V3U4_9AGAR|nr:hypothetical protein C8R41DRAFT_587021 [Lentinula lateritia]